MADEVMIDASVFAAALFDEEHSAAARRFLGDCVSSERIMIASDLMPLEIASIAAKKVWRGECSEHLGAEAVDTARGMMAMPVSLPDLLGRAYDLAARHRFSVYDATYIALAEVRDSQVATLDARLARRAEAEGFADRLVLVA